MLGDGSDSLFLFSGPEEAILLILLTQSLESLLSILSHSLGLVSSLEYVPTWLLSVGLHRHNSLVQEVETLHA